MQDDFNARQEIHKLRRDWLMQSAITEERLADLVWGMFSLTQSMKQLADAQKRTEERQAETDARWDSLMEMLGRQKQNGGSN
jgi:hypothetical protein